MCNLALLGAMGVLGKGLLMINRKWALRDKMPIREIARRIGVSRNTRGAPS